ncbi:MAG: ABC transporter substrate-binding protein [Chloroflexi bacterium]|nr:ABC transporter substrate-binding protein [Chloroflexota bacterium]
MRFSGIAACTIVVLALLLAACAPKLQPAAPVATPAPAAPVSSAPTSNLSPPTSQDPWAKVVQAAKKEGKVNVYSYNMLGDIGVAVSRAFEDKYGIKVEIITGMGAALGERVLTEQRMKTVVADIMDANSFQAGNVKDAGATVSTADLPVLQQKGVWRVDPWASDPDKHILINTLVYMTSFINTDMVKPADEPRTFRELSQPRWKGKMTETDPRLSSGSGNFFTTLLKRKLIDVETVKAIGANDVAFVTNSQESSRGLIQGRFSLLIMISPGTFTLALKDANIPIKPLAMEEGTLVTNRAMAAIKDGPHSNAAKLLTNWLLTDEGQTVFLKAAGLPPVRSDVPDFTPGPIRFTPVKAIAPTLEEERENLRLFREGFMAKLWNK